MELLTVAQAQRIDRMAVEKLGVPLILLMENAGRGLAEMIEEMLPEEGGPLLMLGTGNNGADGLVAARHLLEVGCCPDVWIVGDSQHGSELFAKQLAFLTAAGLEPRWWNPDAAETNEDACNDEKYNAEEHNNEERNEKCNDKEHNGTGSRLEGIPEELISSLRAAAVIVDGLVGTGLTGSLRPGMAAAAKLINWAGREQDGKEIMIISIDVPSGLHGDTGSVSPFAVAAHLTVTFGKPKQGMYLYPGRDYCGEIQVKPLGIDGRPFIADLPQAILTDREMIKAILPRREATAHKGTNGHALIIGGAPGFVGAPVMAAEGAVRSGAGKTSLLVPPSVYRFAAAKAMPEVMTKSLPEGFFTYCENELTGKAAESVSVETNGNVSVETTRNVSSEATESVSSEAEEQLIACMDHKDAVAVGTGLGRTEAARQLLLHVVKACNSKLVVDADGLYALGSDLTILDERTEMGRPAAIITPHTGEFSRLSGLSAAAIEADRVGVARAFSLQHRLVLVLKGAPTVIACPDGTVYVNSTGNSGMGTGGMGDVLTGIITSLLAQGMAPEEAAVAGVYIHGYSADRLARRQVQGFTPMDVAAGSGQSLTEILI